MSDNSYNNDNHSRFKKKVVVDCKIDHKVVNAGIWKKISLTMITIQQLKQFPQGIQVERREKTLKFNSLFRYCTTGRGCKVFVLGDRADSQVIQSRNLPSNVQLLESAKTR